MRKKTVMLTAVISGALVAPGIAFAQYESEGQEGQQRPGYEQQQQEGFGQMGEQEQQQREGTFGQQGQQGQGEEYVVQEGDTLASIAEEKLGSRDQWQEIARANNIENPEDLQVGKRLKIPSQGQGQSQQQGMDREEQDEDLF